MTNSAPLLETERLILRSHRESDLPDCHALWSDPAVVKYIGGIPATLEETWSRVLRYVGHWGLKGFGYWVVEERSSGRFAGEIGFADLKRNMTPPLDGIPEMGWVLAAWAQGSGYAHEAAGRALQWAGENLAHTCLACLIHPENEASIRLARKLRFGHPLQTEYKGVRTLLFKRGEVGLQWERP